LCITSGAIERGGRVEAPSVRAVLPGSRGDDAALRFVYLGPSKDARALGSGQLRRQVGLKLRAADGCNLVYAMWRFGPDAPRIEVSVKRNPGERSHAECGNGGYTKISGETGLVDPPTAGQAYTLSARLDERILEVKLDDRVVWRGDVGLEAASLRGPAGLRTDNVALEQVELRAAPASPQEGAAAGCAGIAGEGGR
jgi:hypothetical protein